MSASDNDKRKKVSLLIVCYVPEIRNSRDISTNVKNKFFEAAKRRNVDIDLVDEITTRDETRVRSSLNKMANYLSSPNKKGIVYYFGHGDQVRDFNGDEKNDGNGQDAGYDEKWVTQNILDDEITSIFQSIHNESYLFLFSDSCSSGSMIDDNNKKNWATISSSNDKQDSLATTDGGVFTLWGLIPALENLTKIDMNTIHNYIKQNVQIDTQRSILRYGNQTVRDVEIF